MVKATTQPDALLAWMGSLADGTRLRLLRLLERHELGVVELCEILQLPQSTVSRHLKVLGDQGWVRARRQGTTHLYRMVMDELEAATRRLWILAREQIEDWATLGQDELRLGRVLAARERQTQEFFAAKADEWDKLRSELYGDGFLVEAMLALLPGSTVVADLGCGTGAVAARVGPYVQRVIGVDNSAAMLKAARRRTEGLESVELRKGDLTALPIDDRSCDAALMLLVLTYLDDPQAALKETARILKPGGRAVVVDLLPHDRDDFRRQLDQLRMGFGEEELNSLFSAANLVDPRITPLPPESQAKGPALFLATATKN
jgi:ubiquinone/menaquinone biosynthesis C-methylase UbiE/predicted transcriptional regulator